MKFNRKEIFEEVDRSNLRFDKYSREERLKFREEVRKLRKKFDKSLVIV